jgi:4-carboxymuconolactone decarboxylase
MARFAEIPLGKWTTEQKAVAEEIVAGPRGAIGGPFPTWLRKPELAARLQKLGEYIRFERDLPIKFVSIAILMTARHWRCQYEWDFHTKTARDAGISQRAIDRILANETPDDFSDGEQAVHAFCRALHRDRDVTDAEFAAARDALGEEGVVELIAISGYYTMMAMALNVSQVPPVSGKRTDFPDA